MKEILCARREAVNPNGEYLPIEERELEAGGLN